MAGMKDIANIWKNVREVDLRPIREEALEIVRIVLAGAPGAGRHTLAGQLSVDPAHPDMHVPIPIKIFDVNSQEPLPRGHLVILMLDATRSDFRKEAELAQKWGSSGQKVLLFINKVDMVDTGQVLKDWLDWPVERLVYGSANDTRQLEKRFVPIVMEMLPDQLLSLGRHFPLFRVSIANHVINDTCFANGAYALSTGVAEVVPALGVPLNIADMVVLTKAQAFLVYKLGLTLGFSTEWRDYISEFSSVIGTGFLWRQMARQLVGLIPIWGIVPKTAVAYAGTYVVGHAVLRWYLTGKHLTRAQIRELYVNAFHIGKNVARQILAKTPRPRLPRLVRRKPAKLPKPHGPQECPHCGRSNSPDALYCQYCGLPLSSLQSDAASPEGPEGRPQSAE